MRLRLAPPTAACLTFVTLVGLGAALRLFWIADVQPAPTHDAKWYVGRAEQFAAGEGVSRSDRPTAYRPVGYPVVLGTAFAIAGVHESVHRFVNVALAVVTLVCLCLATLRLTRSPVAAGAATLLFACYPADIAYTSLAVSEPLFNACMLAAVAAWWSRHARLGLVACATLVFGAAMTRASGVFLPLLIGGLAPFHGPANLRSRLIRLAALLALFVALLVPWWIRNARAFGGFVPIANNGGVNLFIGNNSLATGGYRFDRAVLAELPADIDPGWLGSGGPKEYQIDRRLSRLATEYMFAHSGEVLALVPAKLRFLFASDHTAFEWCRSRGFVPSSMFHRAYELNRTYYAGLWLFAIAASAVLLLRRRKRWQQALALALATLASVLAGVSLTWAILGAVLVAVALLRDGSDTISVPWLSYATLAAFTGLQIAYFGDARFHHAMMPWVSMLAATWFAFVGRR